MSHEDRAPQGAGVARDSHVGRNGTLRAEFARRELSRHLALFADSQTAQLRVAAAFIANALQNDQRCLYLAETNDRDRIRTAFDTAGIDVATRLEAGDLEILDATEVYLDNGFEPELMIETLEDACAASLEAGYEGVSVAGENTWCFHTDVTFDHILEFEADFDATCPDLPITALCQYDLDQFGEESIAKALWTHEQIIYRGTICENPYYVPPAEFQAAVEPHLNARLLLEQAYDLTRTRREIEQREQRLSVVNRVLRHNIRNDLNAILGSLSLVQDRDFLDTEARERLQVVEEYAREIVGTAEKARIVQQTVAEGAVEPLELETVVDCAIDRVESTHPDATIERPSDGSSLTVFADTHFEKALVELLTNAIVHQHGDDPTVTVSVSTCPAGFASVEVRNPGQPIPDAEQQALLHGTETPLEHGSGLGLWLVKWIVEQSAGRLHFPDSDGDVCRIAVDLRRVRTSSDR